jgi:hypothetical protein
MKHVAKAQPIAVGEASGTNNMAREVNGLLAIRQDRLYADPISVLNLEFSKLIAGSLQALRSVVAQRYCYTLLVSVDPFDPDVVGRSRCGEASGVVDD